MTMTPPVFMLSLPINYEKLFKDCKRKLIFGRKRQYASPTGVNAILEEEEQGGDSSDKLLKEIEEEYNTTDKTDPNANEHLANLINKRFAGKLKETKLKEKLEL